MSESPELKSYREIEPPARAGGTDLTTPEAVVTAMYDLLSGPAESERERDWDRFRSLALPGVRFLICHGWTADGSITPGLREWDLEGFIADAKRAYASDGFWEWEVGGRTERFGGIAHRFSSYESRVASPDSEPVGRGVNSIQLARHGGRWWLVSVIWDAETPERPIPPEYLESDV
jgi:hypothetical protein